MRGGEHPYFVGYLDEARVFSEAVNETRVKADYFARLNELLVKKEITLADYFLRVFELKTRKLDFLYIIVYYRI